MRTNEFRPLEMVPAKLHLKRLSAVLIPAGLVTASLFTAMQHMIAVDDFSPPELTGYILEPYMEAEVKEDPQRPERRPTKLDPIDPPPRPPSLVKEISNVDLPVSGYEGVAPSDYGASEFRPILPERVSAIQVRNLQPITPPVPVYPRRAQTLGLDGTCEVSFSVTMRGEPVNVQADCTDRVFEAAATKAVQKVKFVPQIRDGLPVTVTGVVYPLEFRMEP